MTRLQIRSQDSQADVWKASCPPGVLHYSPGASPSASLPCSRGMKVPAAAALKTDEVPGRLAPPRDASLGGCPTSSSRAGSSFFRGVFVPDAQGCGSRGPGTARLPVQHRFSPSLPSGVSLPLQPAEQPIEFSMSSGPERAFP